MAFKLLGFLVITWRGGGFRDQYQNFYKQMTGKYYRIPGFLATSLNRNKAMDFIHRAHKAHPRILWCILVCAPDQVLHLTPLECFVSL